MRTDDTRINNWRLEIPNDDPAASRLLVICTALAAELSVVRERLDTVERLAERAGVFAQADIEAFQPDPAASIARDGLRKRLLAHVFRALKMDGERQLRKAKAGLAGDPARGDADKAAHDR